MRFRGGDRFRFMGLDGDVNDRTLTVLGISVTGSLNLRVDMDIDEGFEIPVRPGITSVPYDAAVKMVALGIWQRAEEP